MKRAQRGDAAAIEALARHHLRPAYLVALSLLGRPADADDVAQDALVVALQRIRTLKKPERFDAWLSTIVRNRALNALKKRSRVEGRSSTDEALPPSMPRVADTVGLREQLMAALDTLTATQRQVVLLHDLEGWTHAEIAAAVGTSEGMSRQHLFHARRALRERVKE